MGLGGFPEVPLAAAKTAAREAREMIRKGIDPIEARKAAQSALKAASARMMTFKEAAEAYIAAHEDGWKNEKHRQQWANTLSTYAHPKIGALSVADIDLPHILEILEPVWKTKTETAKRLRGRIEVVLDWATTRGYRQGLNPARWRGHLDKLLARPSRIAKPVHHDALPISDIGQFMVRLRNAEGMGAKALEFAILCAARSGEVRGATWSEIDLKAKVWTVSAERMKAGREHRVPLSQAAIDLLEGLPRMAGTDLIFPAPRGGALSDMTLSAVLRRMKVPAVPHGFRSTFRDWVSERTSYPGEMAEMALAHTISNKVEAAYRRGDLFDKRRRLMDDWAAFLARNEEPASVIPIRGVR
jgi:integrase